MQCSSFLVPALAFAMSTALASAQSNPPQPWLRRTQGQSRRRSASHGTNARTQGNGHCSDARGLRFALDAPGERCRDAVLDVRAAASGGSDRVLSPRTFVEP